MKDSQVNLYNMKCVKRKLNEYRVKNMIVHSL